MNQMLVTAQEAAAQLNIDRSTLLRWSNPALLPEHRRLEVAHKLPGRTGATLFDQRDIDRLKRENALRSEVPA